jgi:hypothetical protein
LTPVFKVIARVMKKLLVYSLLSLAFATASAQEAKKSAGRPNIPGTFLVEFGFNRALNASDTFNIGFFGSRTVNLYYQYEIKLGKGKFSFNPGLGLGMERFKFKDAKTPAYDADGDLQMQAPLTGTTKSQLIANYLDAPIEFRFNANPYDPNRSFKAAIGFRPGLLISAHTKQKYEQDGDVMKLKDKRQWNLNNFRYGVYGRIGVGNFNVYSYYNLSTYFQEGKGIQGSDINVLTVGISLAGF